MFTPEENIENEKTQDSEGAAREIINDQIKYTIKSNYQRDTAKQVRLILKSGKFHPTEISRLIKGKRKRN